MQKIIPNLWFQGNAEDGVNFYLSVFPEAKILTRSYYPKEGLLDFQKPLAGKVLTIVFELWGQSFVAINAGDEFTPSPANSFIVNFDPARLTNAREQIERMWNSLTEKGKVRMPLSKYDFSELYGWVEDQYGFNWQLILTDPKGEPRPFIVPCLLFTGAKPQAEQAIHFYQSIFKNSKIGKIIHYDPKLTPEMKEMIMFSDFTLEEQWFVAMDGGESHNFSFNEAVSYYIGCKDQSEINYYWEKLISNGGEESVCGWCKDKFGISWQVSLENMEKLLLIPGAWEKLLQMKKIIIEKLKG